MSRASSNAVRAKVEMLAQRVVRAIGPYADSVVLVGGFARELYRHHPEFSEPGFVPLATLDIDLAVREPLLMQGDASLAQRLQAEGLVRYTGLDLRNRPAIHRFHLREDGAERPATVYVEIIVPLHGQERDRPSRPQPDLLAPALRYVDLLMADALTITDPALGRPVRIPHPAAFIVQKTCMRSERRQKAARDQADVFYVALGFAAQWSHWADTLKVWSTHRHWGPWCRRALTIWGTLYGSSTSVGSLEVAAAYPGIATAERVHRVMCDLIQALNMPPTSPIRKNR